VICGLGETVIWAIFLKEKKDNFIRPQ